MTYHKFNTNVFFAAVTNQ